MNPILIDEAEDLLRDYPKSSNDKKIIIAPPFLYLEDLMDTNPDFEFSAQNCHWENQGAYTGEISSLMLKKMGVGYVILGHSERRSNFNETNEIIAKKLETVMENNLTPILLVGETNKDDDKEEIIKNQIESCISSSEKRSDIILAYEPAWAVGSRTFQDLDEISDASKLIRSLVPKNLNLKAVIYGGSVSTDNAKDILAIDNIDGAIVGGASLDSKKFNQIVSSI